MNPIIFLDIDGVLNSVRSTLVNDHRKKMIDENEDIGGGDVPRSYCQQQALETADHISIGLVNLLIEETKAKIVVSSSHRLYFIKRYGYAELPIVDLVGLRNYIHEIGVVGEVIDATPTLNKRRGWEIKEWLDKHPEVTDYVILDDDCDMLEEQLGRFVHTSTVNGFMMEHYRKALKILTGQLAPVLSYQLSRTDESDSTTTCFEFDEPVEYFFQGMQGRGIVKGLAFQNHDIERYVIEDISGHFPCDEHPFSHIVVESTSLVSSIIDRS